MDSKLALDKIKEAESKAQRIIDEAKLEAQKILHEAKLEKEQFIEIALEKAKTDSQDLKNKINAEALQEVSAIENRTKDEINVLKEKAWHNLDKAVGFIRSKLD
jgi:ATP synthase H subunit